MQHDLPPSFRPARGPSSPAASPSVPDDWRLRAHPMLFWLALAATLPRVLWASLSLAAEALELFSTAIAPFRVIALVASVVVIVIVAQLRFLDALPEGKPAANLRKATFAFLIFDVCWGLLQSLVLPTLGDVVFGNVVFRVVFFAVVPAVADVVFALWLGQLLLTAKKQPVLPAVVWLSVAVSVVANVASWPHYAWAVVNIAVVIAMLVEVLRVRRALTEPG